MYKADGKKLDLKLISMVTLTLVVLVPLLALLARKEEENVKRTLVSEIPPFLSTWTLLTGSFWLQKWILGCREHDCNDGTALKAQVLLKLIWSCGLLAGFLGWGTSLNFWIDLAREKWGEFLGSVMVYGFACLWMYTVFSFYYFNDDGWRMREVARRGVGPAVGGTYSTPADSSNNSPKVVVVPVETERATGIASFLAITIFYYAARGYLPNFGEQVVTFCKIWMGWSIIFALSFYFLLRNDGGGEGGGERPGRDEEPDRHWLGMDFAHFSRTTCWNLFLMASILSLFTTLYRESHSYGFHIYEFYSFCLCLLLISVGCIRIFRWLDGLSK